MTTPTSMGNHGGTVTSCSPYAYPGFAEICILLRTWSNVAPGTYELAYLIKAYGGLWGPLGTYGGLWGPIGTFGDVWGPMGAYWHL